jgi:glycosyltransferase involved in cell wall biosynthesis
MGAWWLPSERVRYIPNGVDLGRFAPPTAAQATEARRRLGCGGSEVVIGSVGRLGGEKNHERLVRAFAAITGGRPARLLLVGDGPLRDHLGRLVRDLGLESRVLFAGWAADPLDLYHTMDLFALPSDTEQMPIALLEAMGVGLPAVSTDVGDVRDMVSPENRAFVVPAGREDAFRDALGTLVDDATVRALLGRANRTTCRGRYGLDAMIESYLDLYREALEDARRRVPARL